MDRRQRIDALLDAALDHEGAARGAFLDRECPREYRADLERMLGACVDSADDDDPLGPVPLVRRAALGQLDDTSRTAPSRPEPTSPKSPWQRADPARGR